MDDKDFSQFEVSEIKAYFGQEKLKHNIESDLGISKIRDDVKPFFNKYILNDKLITKEMINKKSNLTNNLEPNKIKTNNEHHNKLIFQISKPLNNKTNIQTLSPHIFKNNNIIRNLCPYKDENIENISNTLSNPLYSQFNTLNGEEYTNYSETNETDAASTCISDNQSIKFNFFRRHLFNTPSSDKAIRNKIINSGNDEDRKSVPTKKSNNNDLKEENLKIFQEKKNNFQEFRRISGNTNVINQIIIPEEHSVSRNSNNESSENKLIKEQIKNEQNSKCEINENEETGIKKQKKKRHQKFKKNKTQINLNKIKNPNIELKKNNSECFSKEVQKSPEKTQDIHSDSERNINKFTPNLIKNEILSVSNINENGHSISNLTNISSFSKEGIGKKLNKSQSQNLYVNNRSNNVVNSNFFRLNDHKQIGQQWSTNNIFHLIDPFTAIESKSKSNSGQFPYYNNPFFGNLSNQYNYMLMSNPSINSTGNNSIHKDFTLFYNKFSNDIRKYSMTIDEFNQNLKEVKEFCINFIQNLLKTELSKKNIKLESEISIHIYGSFATDLSIESSDIDVTIKIIEMPKFKQIDNLLINISKILNDSKLFESVNPICSASVPIIKLVFFIIKSEN
jgi:predicted nucleotidyltransferase